MFVACRAEAKHFRLEVGRLPLISRRVGKQKRNTIPTVQVPLEREFGEAPKQILRQRAAERSVSLRKRAGMIARPTEARQRT